MDVSYLFCNYPNRHSTSCSTRKLPDRVVEGLQLCSARTFYITLSPWIYKGRHGPPRNTSTPKAIQTTTQDVGYYATCGLNLSKPRVAYTIMFLVAATSHDQSSTLGYP